VSNPSATGIAYVSLPRGNFPTADRVDIQVRRTGAQVTAVLFAGGFEPVPVAAGAGDTLDLRIGANAGVPKYFSVVPAHHSPVLVLADPASGRRDVASTAVLRLVFSEPIDAATLSASSVQLYQGGIPVAGTLAFADSANLAVTFVPAVPLAPGTSYALGITQQLVDLNGEALQVPVAILFLTKRDLSPVVTVYERVTPVSVPGYLTRYVLDDQGAFELQYESAIWGSFLYAGHYVKTNSTITLYFDDNVGQWVATALLQGDSLIVEYPAIMQLDDFEDGVYVERSSPGNWVSLTPMPEPRWQAAAVALNGIIYVAGGVSDLGAGPVNPAEILAYDPAKDTWRTAGTLPYPVRGPTMAAVGNLIYVIGGFRDNPFDPGADLQIFDPATGTVVAGPPMPTPRGGVAVVVLNNRIHAIGGVYTGSDPILGEWTNAHEVFDPVTGSWSSLAPGALGGHGAVAVNGKIYVAGGPSSSLDTYDPASDSWTSITSPLRILTSVATIGGKVYLLGGFESQPSCCGTSIVTRVDRFDPTTGAWDAVSPMITSGTDFGVTVVDDAIYVVGGSSTGGVDGAFSVAERFALQ
jgi:N-acetylneuraminic acid mutarotase